MNCKSCGTPLHSTFSSIVVCPQCNTANNYKVNLLRHIRLSKRTALFGTGITLLLIIIGLGGVGAYQINKNADLFSSAKTKINQEQYSDADLLLKKTDHYFTLPSIRKQIHLLQAKNKQWVTDQSYLQQATVLSQKTMFPQALDLLSKINKDFPSYKKVTSLTSSIAAEQKALADAQAAKAAADARAAAAKNSTASGSKNIASTKGTGKRFTSTAAMSSLANAGNITQAQQALQSFVSQYGLTVQIVSVAASGYPSDSFNTLTDADLANLKTYGALFIDEWAKYPTDWVVNSKLKSIALVKNFAVSGTVRAAGPDPIKETMYYSVSYSGEYAREVVHHEYDHLLTYNYFGSWAPSDPTWLSFNPPGFSYGNGGASCYVPGNSCLTGEHPIAGFVSGYAASAIEEDKAELYGYLMDSTYYHQVKSWVTSDPYLANKVNNYKQFMASHSPEMSGSYFDDINP